MPNELIKFDPQSLPGTSEVLGQTVQGVVEGLTGLAASDKRELVRSVGFVLQRIRGGSFLNSLREEWNQYREKGRIREDYERTEQHLECLQEMLDFIDKELPDKVRFESLKKILLVAATEAHSNRDSVLPQQYMRLVRDLNSGEILVLLTTFNRAHAVDNLNKDTSANTWLQEIATASGLQYPELVALHERRLMEKNLISPRTHADQSGVFRGQHNRLTELSYRLCEYISRYPSP